MDMSVDPNPLVQLPFSYFQVKHCYFDPNSGVGYQVLQIVSNLPLLKDGPAHSEDVRGFSFVEVRFVNHFLQFCFGIFDNILGGKALLFQPGHDHRCGLVFGLDRQHQGNKPVILLELDGSMRICLLVAAHGVNRGLIVFPPFQNLVKHHHVILVY